MIRSESVDDEAFHHPGQLWKVPALLGPVTQARFVYSPVWRQCVTAVLIRSVCYETRIHVFPDNLDWTTGPQYLWYPIITTAPVKF